MLQGHWTSILTTYASVISMDATESNVFTLTLTGATALLDNPDSLEDGQSLTLRIAQDNIGGRELTFGTRWDFGADGVPDLTTEVADSVAIITATTDGINVFATIRVGYAPA